MFKLILFFIFLLSLSFVLYLILDIFYYLIKFRDQRISTDKVVFQESTWFYKIFVLFPKAYATEILSRDPNDFKDTGLILFEGEQGAGKTMAMTQYCNILKAKYPLLQKLTLLLLFFVLFLIYQHLL